MCLVDCKDEGAAAMVCRRTRPHEAGKRPGQSGAAAVRWGPGRHGRRDDARLAARRSQLSTTMSLRAGVFTARESSASTKSRSPTPRVDTDTLDRSKRVDTEKTRMGLSLRSRCARARVAGAPRREHRERAALCSRHKRPRERGLGGNKPHQPARITSSRPWWYAMRSNTVSKPKPSWRRSVAEHPHRSSDESWRGQCQCAFRSCRAFCA